MEQRAVTATVHGRVQGVGFRYATRRAAQTLGVSGWVRNDADGTVRVFAQGDAEDVESLVEFLHDGPPGAHVAEVEVADADPRPNLLGFDVRR